MSNHCNDLRSPAGANGQCRRDMNKGVRGLALLAILSLAIVWSLGQGASATTLTSSTTGKGGYTDPNMLNSWGFAINHDGLLWVANNKSGLVSLYLGDGQPTSTMVLIPTPDGVGQGSPTGLVLDRENRFRIPFGLAKASSSDEEGEDGDESDDSEDVCGDSPAILIVATEEGALAAWSPSLGTDKALIVADHSGERAVYKGLALAKFRDDHLLYATDFYNAKVDIFDSNFQRIDTIQNPSAIPDGYAPFGVHVIGRQLYVTYAKQLMPEMHQDEIGLGNGYVSVFKLNGEFQRNLISRGPLNSPWAVTTAPESFGAYGRKLLVGNAGDGVINVFDRRTGEFKGFIAGPSGPVTIDGLWGISIRKVPESLAPEEMGFSRYGLYFTAGPNQRIDGELGVLLVPRRTEDSEDDD